MQTELVNACALACTRNTTDAYTHTVAGMRKTTGNHLLRQMLMFRTCTLKQSHGTAQHRDISTENTLNILVNAKLRALPTRMEVDIGVYTTGTHGACLHAQSFILGVVLRMFHSFTVDSLFVLHL